MGAVSRPGNPGGRGGRGNRGGQNRPPTLRGTEPQLRADLAHMGHPQCAQGPRKEGAERAACELYYLRDEDLAQLGMDHAQLGKMRELLAESAGGHPPVNSVAMPLPQQHQRCGPTGGGSRGAAVGAQPKLRPEQLLEKVRMAKKVGNQMMKAADLHGSARMYKHGISMVEQLLRHGFADAGLQKSVIEMYAALQINAAHVCFKQRDYEACIHHAQKVLEFEPNNAPALYRRGQALAMLNNETDLHCACIDLERVVMNDRGNHFAQQQLVQCQSRLHDHLQYHATRGRSVDEDALSMRDTTYISSKASSADSVGTPPTESPRGCAHWQPGNFEPRKVVMPGMTMSDLAALVGLPPGLDLPESPSSYKSGPPTRSQPFWPAYAAAAPHANFAL